MKNKESKRTNSQNNEIKKRLKQGASASSIFSPKKQGPSNSQINRLKKFYNTTRFLSNSAFTTYFGKPAFENYGNANTNPVAGGLFYGNYMLSHNMNPIDGSNHPTEKQVYSSAMMKSLQRDPIRKPSPPRMVPDEIRNTPEEIAEINARSQIYQLPNNIPSREIIPPNLLKARYFHSGHNSPNESVDLDEGEEYEVWSVENVLGGKKNKTKRIAKDDKGKTYNPYEEGKVKVQKKKVKEDIDNKISEDLYQKVREKKEKKKEKEQKRKDGKSGDKQSNIDEEEEKYQKEKAYLINMLGEDGLNSLEDIGELKLKQKQIETEIENKEQNEAETKEIVQPCQLCLNCRDGKSLTFKSKENPALLSPGEINNEMICCMHHSKECFNTKDKDPRSYTNMPPCMMCSIIPAGKPLKRNDPFKLS